MATINMDDQPKPNGQRAGILDKRVSFPQRTGSNDKSDHDSAYVSRNVKGCTESGCNRMDGIPAWQNINKNAQNAAGALLAHQY
jgi:hypothetical protein